VRKALQDRIQEKLRLETERPVDENLLNKLREAAAEETNYFKLEPEKLNALNDFFREVKDIFLTELVTGNYGANIVLDSIIVLCFETGYKIKEWEVNSTESTSH